MRYEPYTFRLIRGTHDWAYIGLMIAITTFAYICYIFPIKPVFAESPIKDTRVHERYCAGLNMPCVDSIEELKLDFPETEKEKIIATLRSVCDEQNGGKDCWKILYGMVRLESNMNANAIGDSGKSLGFMQIHAGYHPEVPDSCRTDLYCSTSWSLRRMIAYGFRENQKQGIRKHNGGLNNPKTLDYYNSVIQFAEQAN
jgi:hypothetical protein